MIEPLTDGSGTGITAIRLWLAVNDCGDSYVSTESPSDALTGLINDNACQTARVVQLNVNIPTPKISQARIDVPQADTGALVSMISSGGVSDELSNL